MTIGRCPHRRASEIVPGRVWTCIFDDLVGLTTRDIVGVGSILFETDYPHSDGTFPDSMAVAHSLFERAGMDAADCHRVLRGNAIDCYGLDRFGIAS